MQWPVASDTQWPTGHAAAVAVLVQHQSGGGHAVALTVPRAPSSVWCEADSVVQRTCHHRYGQHQAHDVEQKAGTPTEHRACNIGAHQPQARSHRSPLTTKKNREIGPALCALFRDPPMPRLAACMCRFRKSPARLDGNGWLHGAVCVQRVNGRVTSRAIRQKSIKNRHRNH